MANDWMDIWLPASRNRKFGSVLKASLCLDLNQPIPYAKGHGHRQTIEHAHIFGSVEANARFKSTCWIGAIRLVEKLKPA